MQGTSIIKSLKGKKEKLGRRYMSKGHGNPSKELSMAQTETIRVI